MRVLVCGGRDYDDRRHVFTTLSRLHDSRGPFSVVVHGAAAGADTLAGEWAVEAAVVMDPYPVSPEEWREIGRAAGPIRNKRMLLEGRPDLVVAFPGGRGTANMKKQAREAGVEVIEVGASVTA